MYFGNFGITWVPPCTCKPYLPRQRFSTILLSLVWVRNAFHSPKSNLEFQLKSNCSNLPQWTCRLGHHVCLVLERLSLTKSLTGPFKMGPILWPRMFFGFMASLVPGRVPLLRRSLSTSMVCGVKGHISSFRGRQANQARCYAPWRTSSLALIKV